MHPPPGVPGRGRGGADQQNNTKTMKTMKEFSMWLVGGNYVGMKRHAAAAVAPLPRTESSDRLKRKVDEMKRKLKEEQRMARQGVSRRDPRLATARGVGAPPAHGETAPAPHTPPRDTSPSQRRPQTSPHDVGMQQDNRVLLKTSLIDSITHSNYISMFPPLFTPYDRHNHMLRGWDPSMKKTYDGEAAGDLDGTIDSRRSHRPQALAPQPQQDVPKVNVAPGTAPSGAKRPPTRPKNPGKPGFYPTGSSVNAYRHYTNYRLALALEAKEKQEKAKHPASLKQLLRAQNASNVREQQGLEPGELPLAMRRLSQTGSPRGSDGIPSPTAGALVTAGGEEAAPPPPVDVEKAKRAVKNLNKQTLAELKAFARPPGRVALVCDAVCVILGAPTGWANAQKLLASAGLPDQLLGASAAAISDEAFAQLEALVCHKEFRVDEVTKSSVAAATLCLWVLSVYQERRAAA